MMSREELTAMRAHARRAADRAKQRALQPGDRFVAVRCGGGAATYTFAAWEGDFLVSKTGVLMHPINVTRLNGRVVSFADP